MFSDNWSRGEVIAAITLIVGILACIAAFLVIPEFRRFVGFDNLQNSSSQSDLLYQYKMLADELQELKRKRMLDEKTIAKLKQDIQKFQATFSNWELSDEEYAESQRLSAQTDSLLKEANSILDKILSQ